MPLLVAVTRISTDDFEVLLWVAAAIANDLTTFTSSSEHNFPLWLKSQKNEKRGDEEQDA